MPEPAVRIESLSKAYRIGVGEVANDSLGSAVISFLKSPARNLRNLRRLNTFNADEESDDLVWALRDVSMDIPQGEVLGVIGRNGAGKSTLLKVLSRITEPTRGRVVINGKVASLLEVGTGFHPELTGRENVYMNGTILGMRKRDIDRKFDEIIAFSGVERFIETPIKRYSSGMKVRLAFSVAAHLDPEILIIDEVLAVGDSEFQKRCLGKMSEVARGGRTVLFVSHNMDVVQRLCTRCVLIEGGRIAADGETEDVVAQYLGARGGDAGARYVTPEVALDSGTDAVRLEEAFVVDSEGEQSGSLRYGEPFELCFRWRSDQAQPGSFFYVRVFDQQGRLLFTVNTNGHIEVEKGTTEVRCRFDHSMFVVGDYMVTAGCFRKPKQTLAEADGVLQFSVLEVRYAGVTNSFAVRSIFDPRPSWTSQVK